LKLCCFRIKFVIGKDAGLNLFDLFCGPGHISWYSPSSHCWFKHGLPVATVDAETLAKDQQTSETGGALPQNSCPSAVDQSWSVIRF